MRDVAFEQHFIMRPITDFPKVLNPDSSCSNFTDVTLLFPEPSYSWLLAQDL